MQASVWVGVMCNVTAPIRFVASIFRWSCDQILQFAPHYRPFQVHADEIMCFRTAFPLIPPQLCYPTNSLLQQAQK